MRRNYEEAHGRVTNEEFEELPSHAESHDEGGEPLVDRRGILRIRRKVSKVPAPRNSEEVRRRIRLLAASFEVGRMRNRNKSWLIGLDAAVWEGHARYILSGKVAHLKITTKLGDKSPHWSTVLAYELRIRKEAVTKVVYEKATPGQALESARRDTELRELHLITPTIADVVAAACESAAAASANAGGHRAEARYSPYPPVGRGKGQGKAKGRGKARGKGKGQGSILAGVRLKPWTPGGRRICFAFNNPAEKCDGACGMIHCCRICFSTKHAAHNCPDLSKARKGEASAAANRQE